MRGGKKEGAGRPVGTLRPSGLITRSIRMTDEEYDLVREMLKRRRNAIKKLKLDNKNKE